jgi:hypothetical protein
MRATNSLARWGLAACLVGSAGLVQAQETGFVKDFKLRGGYALSSKDHLRPWSQGFGLNLGWAAGSIGKFGLELGYTYKTGDTYFTQADGSMVTASPTTTDHTPGGVAMLTDPFWADMSKSAEDKRNEFSGFTLRLSYQNKINENWEYQAGLQLGGKFKHQYVGDVRSGASWGSRVVNGVTEYGYYGAGWGGDWSGPSANSWRDLYNGTPVEGGVNVTPYLGVSYNFDKDSSLEMNVVFLRYTAIEYKHYAGTGVDSTGAPGSGYDPGYPGWGYPPHGRVSSSDAIFPYDKLEKNNRMVPHIEFAYVFHF